VKRFLIAALTACAVLPAAAQVTLTFDGTFTEKIEFQCSSPGMSCDPGPASNIDPIALPPHATTFTLSTGEVSLYQLVSPRTGITYDSASQTFAETNSFDFAYQPSVMPLSLGFPQITEADFLAGSNTSYATRTSVSSYREIATNPDGSRRREMTTWAIRVNQDWNTLIDGEWHFQSSTLTLDWTDFTSPLSFEDLARGWSADEFAAKLLNAQLQGGPLFINASTTYGVGEHVYQYSYGGDGRVTSIDGIAAPVPEPETYALMLLGLAAVMFAARRRAK
jgi:hypothetical protein